MEENQSLLDLELNQDASRSIIEASRWGKLMAILILVVFGLGIAMVGVFWNAFSQSFFNLQEPGMENNGNMLLGIILGTVIFVFIIAAILMGFLIRAAIRIRNGIRNGDQVMFNSGLANLKNYFAMYGVLGIIGLLFMLIGLLNN